MSCRESWTFPMLSGECRLSGCHLGKAELSQCHLGRAELSRCHLGIAELSGCHRGEAERSRCHTGKMKTELSGCHRNCEKWLNFPLISPGKHRENRLRTSLLATCVHCTVGFEVKRKNMCESWRSNLMCTVVYCIQYSLICYLGN